ncbi:hypothetical protein PR003_g14932 [Phytophthora rubi]|uniref:Integrase catalytic domain-containing protein n=1 Tax=Phytophthora rubi TaxID=129364 RepID=A0A6A3JZV0_9STRA|nr:hypothetical protein PR001_g19615 [Phytophthora rubi]KAE9331593.1 hypothetical protein PR003_g14932 [Phytophthora rubi]
MRENRLYANINKCIFGAEEIPFLGCFLGKDGVRADPEKVCAIAQWPVPVSQKDLRKWLGLANYLHKYRANYAGMARPLTNLLKKDAVWSWTSEAQQSFEAIKRSLQSAPILALPDEDRPFSVVCDASDFAIGCALLQVDAEGRERVVSFQSRQLKAAEKNYHVHDNELLAMKYALVKFRVHLLGQKPFVIYTDHASLKTATSLPHLSQRMVRWLSFFTEYNFTVEYKPGKQNVLADALSRRPDYELAHLAYLESPLYELIREAYVDDVDLAGLVETLSAPGKAVELTARQRSRLHLYSVVEGLLYYQVEGGDEPRIVVPNDEDLRHHVLYEAHDTPLSGHLGREKTYASVARNFWWPHMYKWVRKYLQTCETCQRVKPAPSASAPLMNLPVPADCWRSVSLDFIFELPADARGHTGMLVFVCRLSKMVLKSVTAPQAAQLFVDNVFCHHGLPEVFVSDRDPRFVSHLWHHLFRLLGTRLDMSTADHPQTDGQTERVNRVLEDIIRSVCAAEPTKWSTLLPQVEFALNNAVHSSTGFTPFYVNGLRHPRTPLTLPPASNLGEGEANAEDPRGLKGLRTSVKRNLLSFIETGEAVRQRVRDAMADAQDTQKEQSDRQGRKNTHVFKLGDQVLLNAKNLPTQAVSAVGSTKRRPRFVGSSRSQGSTATPTRWTCHRPLPRTQHSTLACSSPIARWGLLVLRSRLGRRVLTEGVRHHPNELFRGKLGRGRRRSRIRSTSSYAASLPCLQVTHTVVQITDPGPCPLVALLALRTAGPQTVDITTKLPRQIPDAVSQIVQVLLDIQELLQAGLRILDAGAKRHHLGPLATQ